MIRTLRLAGLAAALAFACGNAAAAFPDKAVKLRWFGQSMFQLETTSGKKVVFDPHAIPEFGRHTVKADVIVC